MSSNEEEAAGQEANINYGMPFLCKRHFKMLYEVFTGRLRRHGEKHCRRSTPMLRLLGAANELNVRRGRGVGAHWIVDLWGASHLTDAGVLATVLETASNAAGATVLKIFLHEFPSSGGVTGVALLAESHMSIHTWPEKDYAAIDIFMCGHADTRRALDVLILQLKPTHTLVEHFVRGADRVIRPRVKNRKASG